jgi:hypothetical protein
MRSVMRALILSALPGAIFAPLIAQVGALFFCREASNDGLLPVIDLLPPCPTPDPTALIVVLAVAAGAVAITWSLAPLYTSRTTD